MQDSPKDKPTDTAKTTGSEVLKQSTAISSKEINESVVNPEDGPRERILSASLELFVKQGYFNSNVPDISKLSKCSVGSIYHHFANKEEIAAMLYQNGIEQFRKAISANIDSEKTIESNIRSIIISFLEFAESNVTLSRYLWLTRHNEFITERVKKPTVVGYDEMGRKLTILIKKGIRAKQIPALKAEVFWSIVFGIPLSYVRDWLEGYNKSAPSKASAVISNACWAALQGAKEN